MLKRKITIAANLAERKELFQMYSEDQDDAWVYFLLMCLDL